MTEAPQGGDDPEIDARLALALARLERRLTERETARVRARITRQMAAVRQIRAIPLANGDEPAPGFDPAPWGAAEEAS